MAAYLPKAPVVKHRSWVRRVICNVLHHSVPNKARVLFAVVLLGSLFCAIEMNPESHFSDKMNPLNLYMVKFSWGWTMLCILPAVLFSSFLYSGFQWDMIVKHFGRVVVAHVIWMTVTTLFVVLDSATGVCTSEGISERLVCLRGGHRWVGFDISGHIFLLTYCIYVLTEECANIQLEVWYEYNSGLLIEHQVTSKLSARKQNLLLQLHYVASWVVGPLELLAMSQVLLWTFMTASTAFYFHSFIEKFLGFTIGFFTWYLTYRCLYGRWSYVPCRPDEGLLNPLKHIRTNTAEESTPSERN